MELGESEGRGPRHLVRRGVRGSRSGGPGGPGGDLGGPDPSLPRGLGVLTPDPGDQVARTLQDHGSRRVVLSGFGGVWGVPWKPAIFGEKTSFPGVDFGGGFGGFLGGFGGPGGYLAGTLKNLEKTLKSGGSKNRPQG